MSAGLDPMLSPERIRQIATQRQVQRYGKVVDQDLLAMVLDPRRSKPFDYAHVVPPDRPASALIDAARTFNALALALDGPPRTKKNHGRAFGIKPSVAYTKWRLDVVAALSYSVRQELNLPLPAIAYNCAATFYVDRRGESADYNGLNQGLHDLLQDAGVLIDDWWIRTCDGTRIVLGDVRPRVELLLSPLPDGPPDRP